MRGVGLGLLICYISTPDISSKSHRIHGTGIFTYTFYHKNQPNVSKHTSPMDPVEMNFRNRKWMGKTRKSSRPNCNQKSSRPTQRGTDMLFFLTQDFSQQKDKRPKNPQEVNHGKHRGRSLSRPIPNFKNPPPPPESPSNNIQAVTFRSPILGGHQQPS